MKSLIEYINEAKQMSDLKVGTVVYFKKHDSNEIFELTIDAIDKTITRYGVYVVKDNKANIDCFGVRGNTEREGMFSVWIITKDGKDTNGFVAFEREDLEKGIPSELEKKINSVMSKISEREAKVLNLNKELEELYKERDVLQKQLTKETK